ncbi:hypothetical protein [Curtobacterium sp. MCBA15_004]|uniref:hypothetical protein n=1 Tax=Curtobacterium sp. MCBA15_004 TaxID=1898733 RepID=UPI001114EEC1|nr:hypothetical protein [Curtobacterium sp. MCBA15_004]WIA95779.1 hypothetical protein QOL16_11735 [Curtobacterium sp. MCBA15_004]
MSNTAPIKPATVPSGSVWDAAQQLWVGPQSEFERGVREGAHNALAFFRDEDGHSTVDEHMADSLDRIEGQAIKETLADEARSFRAGPTLTADDIESVRRHGRSFIGSSNADVYWRSLMERVADALEVQQ